MKFKLKLDEFNKIVMKKEINLQEKYNRGILSATTMYRLFDGGKAQMKTVLKVSKALKVGYEQIFERCKKGE